MRTVCFSDSQRISVLRGNRRSVRWRAGLGCASLLAILASSAAGVEVLPGDAAVAVSQVDFFFPAIPPGSQLDSDWGHLEVDMSNLAAATGIASGFLNVYTDAGWTVQNLWVDLADPFPTVVTYFDLGVPFGTPVAQLSAFIDFDAVETINFADGPRSLYPVGTVEYNAEGVGDEEVTAIGAPAAPGAHVFNLAGATAKVSQPKVPNVQCAKNQCMPMSIANSLEYLSTSYGINVPHDHVKGLKGDNSLVGQLDKKMNRVAPARNNGIGVWFIPWLNGKFDYLASNGLSKKLVHKHQGVGWGGAGNELPAGDFTRHGITSKDQSAGGKVTWEWICDELARGEDVELVFQHDSGGHAVRIFECGETKGKKWLGYVHDRLQSHDDATDTKGLEQVRVYTEDTDGDGTLNFGNNSNEIRIALSESPAADPHTTVPGDQPGGSEMSIGSPEIPPIPADFFDPGSDPFTGQVLLEGDPIDPSTLQDASTVVLRSGTPVFPSDPVSTVGSVDVQITQLNLVSMQPITVTFNGGQNPEDWDVRVTLSTRYPQVGNLTAIKTHANGGTFDLNLPVQPVFTFTRLSDSAVRVIDTGQQQEPPINLSANGVPWVHDLDLSVQIIAPWDGEFVPGVSELIPGIPQTQQPVPMQAETPSQSVRHTVGPTGASLCPLVFETPLDPCFDRRQECVGTASQTCWPTAWTPENQVTQCGCVDNPPGECGALDVTSVPGVISCTAGGPCEVHVDGVSQGTQSISEGSVPADSVVTCQIAEPIPTVSEWGLIVMTVLLLCSGAVVLTRRRSAQEA